MMRFLNKRGRLIAALMVACLLLASCGSKTVQDADHENGKFRIVATIFPEYDWVMKILGDNPAGMEVTLLLDQGVDLHSYQPTVNDIMKITDCDLFIYVGGESDAWVEDALKEAVNPDMRTVNLLDVLGSAAKVEELPEGMQREEEEAEAGETEYDEHVWLSLKNAALLCSAIEEALSAIDPANADTYRQNLTAYQDALDALDKQYAQTVAASETKTLLFGDRFPFRYLTDDYGLTYYAAFAGCAAETEASFETVTFLAKKVDELSLPAVLIIDGSDGKIAETIVSNTTDKSAKILTLDSMQSVSYKDLAAGADYLSIMEQNLAVLREALN
ncbi:MAG: metal ABC transporter substrate-binding protein [Lachnospiraceae bacterium]|nr:metal ABC transporter substrate-binding protein [Lachnospiraceae bacterium]